MASLGYFGLMIFCVYNCVQIFKKIQAGKLQFKTKDVC